MSELIEGIETGSFLIGSYGVTVLVIVGQKAIGIAGVCEWQASRGIELTC